LGDIITIVVFKVLLLEEGSYLLQRADYVVNITLKELVSAKERCGSKFAVLEVEVWRNISTIWNDSWGEGFHGVFILGSGDVVKHLYAIATYRLRCLEDGVYCPDWAALD